MDFVCRVFCWLKYNTVAPLAPIISQCFYLFRCSMNTPCLQEAPRATESGKRVFENAGIIRFFFRFLDYWIFRFLTKRLSD